MIPRRTKSYAAAELVVTDAILAAAATIVAATQLTTGDLVVSTLNLPRAITITRSLATSAYTTDPYAITLKDGTVEYITPANADGGDTLRGSLLLDNIKTIDLPAMGSTGGSHSIGVDDIGAPRGDMLQAVELAADGNLRVQYGEPTVSGGTAGPADVIPITVAQRAIRDITPTRVVTNSAATNPTTVGVTVYY